MSVEIKWTDTDPETGERRYLRAEQFAEEWRFSYRMHRRDIRWRVLTPTRAMWEHVLDGLQRRLQRREGVDESDVKRVEQLLRVLPADENSPGEAE